MKVWGRGDVLYLNEAVRQTIARHAGEAWPYEACGVLVGDGGEVVYQPMTNTWTLDEETRATALHRYAMDIEELAAVWDEGVAIVHSHPGTGADASDRDRAEMIKGLCYVIFGNNGAGGVGEFKAWRKTDHGSVVGVRVMDGWEGLG